MAQRNRKKGYQHWNTPPEVLEPLTAFLPITLDPCSNPNSIVPAVSKVEAPYADGLAVDWHRFGHTFVNPPYMNQPAWMEKAAREFALGAHTITMLIPASTETLGFRRWIFGHATAVAFWKRRLAFLRHDGGKPGNTLPSALPYFGHEVERFCDHFAPHATIVTDWRICADDET